ncbi:hypothetical protein D3C72_1666340 [compost metagenome]
MLDEYGLTTPARRLGQVQQHVLKRRYLPLRWLAKQRHQQNTLQPVHGDLFQPWPAASTAMKQPAGFSRRRAQGLKQMLLEGVDHRSHGQIQWGEAAYSTLPAHSRQRV